MHNKWKQHFFRASKSYTVHGSNDAANWTFLVNGTLIDPQTYGVCDVPVEEVPVDEQSFQYVRLTIVDFYRGGIALNYFSVA